MNTPSLCEHVPSSICKEKTKNKLLQNEKKKWKINKMIIF